MVVNWMYDHDISHACAPFEAEWQCVHLEKTGRVDSIASKDDDCVVLRARIVCHKINFCNKSFKLYEKYVEMDKAEDNPLFKSEEKHWPIIASLLGCDHAKRIPKMGFSTMFKKVLPSVTEINPSNVTK